MKKLAILALLLSSSVNAEMIGKVTTSGVFFKDTIEIHEFMDPTMDGITCHITYPDRSFSTDNPTDSSISCRQTSKTLVSYGEYKKTQENIFSKSKSLFFKVMRVDRFYDAKNNSFI